MTTLAWYSCPDSPAETAQGRHTTYLITADDQTVVLTRYTRGAVVWSAAAESALNAVPLACPLPELQGKLRALMRKAAQEFEDGRDLDAWRHPAPRGESRLAEVPHPAMTAHDGYAPHSHEVRPDHLGVAREQENQP